QLLGASAGNIAWEPEAGQDVIAVAPDHFVATNGLTYPDMRAFGEPNLGIPDGEYPAFRNTPDERYPGTQLLLNGEEDIEVLFASDYAGAQVLGYDLQRPGWQGHTVAYQPGEYQPLALDDREGLNFQILANAIYYVGTTSDDDPSTTGGDTEGPETTGDDTSDDTSDLTTGDAGSSGDEGDDPTGPMSTTGDDPGAEPDTDGAAADTSSSGCHVGAAPTSSLGFGALLILAGLRRRRRVAVRR
ncbi:MAG: MYXO-CTERM sorting domain-containing protein, partial [Myxococcota bacterium]